MTGASVPVTVLISLLIGIAGIVWRVRGQESASIYKQVYERDLRDAKDMTVELASEVRQLTTQVAAMTGVISTNTERMLENASRIRELELP